MSRAGSATYQRTCNRCGLVEDKAAYVNASGFCDPCKTIENRRERRLMDATGLGRDEVRALVAKAMEYAEQRCELCASNRKLVVDHCHVTGVIRGVLCHRCNRALGLLGDDPHILIERLTAYVTKDAFV